MIQAGPDLPALGAPGWPSPRVHAGQLAHEHVLGVVAVLILVDQNVTEAVMGSTRRRPGQCGSNSTVRPIRSSKSTALARGQSDARIRRRSPA